MFRDIVGNIQPNKCFNMWRFSKYRNSYNLVSMETIEFEDKKLVETYKKLKKFSTSNIFFIKEVGERVDDEVKKLGLDKTYDAWVISHISTFKFTISVSIDLFKKDKWYHKLIYILKKTNVIDTGK